MNLPTQLTLLRLFMIPVFVLAFYWPHPWHDWIAATIFTLAGFTDWLDGYLARRWQQTSALGAFLDPVADKLMVLVAVILLVGRFPLAWMLVPAVLITLREVYVSALREWMAASGLRHLVAVGWVGKWKTTAQMVALVGLMLCQDVTLFYYPAIILINISALLALWSMWDYSRAAWPHLRP